MVSQKYDQIIGSAMNVIDMLDDSRRRVATIHQIAEQNDVLGPYSGQTVAMFFNPTKQLRQQIVAAMNIADYIYPLPIGRARPPGRMPLRHHRIAQPTKYHPNSVP